MDERSRASEVDAFQKVRNGMISLDFSSTACWTGTSPLRVAATGTRSPTVKQDDAST
jgi:hypothetical protein